MLAYSSVSQMGLISLTIGAALVAPQAGHLERVINSVQRAMIEHPDFELLEVGVAYLEEA